jgi:hypothetical protein
MGTHHGLMAFSIALVLSGCAALNTDKEPLRITPRSEVATSPVVREVLPQPALSPVAPSQTLATAKTEPTGAAPTLAKVAPALTAPAVAPSIAAPLRIPLGTLYICTATVNGQVQQTAIEFEPKVKQLCGRHPEMGVCQYEREACRASGGRVHTAAGTEITRRTEAEYDKKVLRVRLRAG